MSDLLIRISQLPTGVALALSDETVFNISGGTYKVPLSLMKSAIGFTAHEANAAIHRQINDAGSANTDLWSAAQIIAQLALKAAASHNHNASDINAGVLGIARGGTGLSTIASGKLLYASALDTLTDLTLSTQFDIIAGTLNLLDNKSIQKCYFAINGTDVAPRKKLNLIGSGLSGADNSTDDRVDITLEAWIHKGYMQGPPLKYNDAASIIIPAGFRCLNSDNTTFIEVGSDLTVSLATSGANGLDTGSEANSTWYYPYLIRKTDGTVAGVLSTINEAVSGSITYPSGYNQKKQLPIAIRNDGSGNIIPFVVGSGWPYRPRIIYNQAINTYNNGSLVVGSYNVLNAGTAATWTDISCTNYIPPISQIGIFAAHLNASGAMSFREDGSANNGITVGAGASLESGFFDMETSSAQVVEYQRTRSTPTGYLEVMGFVVTEVN